MLELYVQVWNFHSEWIHANRTLNKKLLHDKTYYHCRAKFPKCLAQMVIRAQHDVVAAYRSARKNGSSWDAIQEKEPFEKSRLSIRLDKRLYTMSQTNIRLSTISGRINCCLFLYPRIKEMFSKYPVCDPLIFERNGEFFLSITFNTPEMRVEGSLILGIDVGEKRFITTSEGKCLAGRDLSQYKRNKRYLHRVLQAKKKSSSARHKLKKSRRKQRNHARNYIHHVSNKILEETSADVIVLEDMSGIKQKRSGRFRNRKKHQYPWKMLREFLTYKALFVNKRVETVNPYNTSKDDYRAISQGIRKGCRYYGVDGLVFDADWNAAINIAQRHAFHSKLPISFGVPFDGALDFEGRLRQEPIVNSTPL